MEAAFAIVRVSGNTPFTAGCTGPLPQSGTLYSNAEVEPYVSVNPRNHDNIIGVWQQDRFSNGGARGLLTGFSRDGGKSWTRTFAHFTRCSGGHGESRRGWQCRGDVYDFRKDNADPNVLLTNYWLVKSTDGGATWRETGVAGPFDMRTAPNARGFFVGDYEGMTTALMPFFVQANSGNTSNRTDVFAALSAEDNNDTAGNERQESGGGSPNTRQRINAHREVHSDRR